MSGVPRRYVRAFLVGCIEPDRNPATYFKGSIRCQWLRGHNYGNSLHYMTRISRRLEHKERLHMMDYYTMGKLIHYTTDAFTYAHNAEFSENLTGHLEYETALQNHFLEYLQTHPQVDDQDFRSVMAAIRAYHRDYIHQDVDIHNDSKFALQACCCVLALLLTPRIL